MEWLADYLTEQGGCAARTAIVEAGSTSRTQPDDAEPGSSSGPHPQRGAGFPRMAFWLLPSTHDAQARRPK